MRRQELGFLSLKLMRSKNNYTCYVIDDQSKPGTSMYQEQQLPLTKHSA